MSLFELQPAIGTYDPELARRKRDAAIDNAEGGAEALKSHRAYEALLRVAKRQETFIVDDVQESWGESFAEGRAMGGVMRRAVREGVAELTKEYRPSARVSSHGNPRVVYKSLVFKAGAE